MSHTDTLPWEQVLDSIAWTDGASLCHNDINVSYWTWKPFAITYSIVISDMCSGICNLTDAWNKFLDKKDKNGYYSPADISCNNRIWIMEPIA